MAGQPGSIPNGTSAENRRLIEAIISWRAGNDDLNSGNAALALDRFENAARLVPDGKIYAMNAVLSLAALGQWEQVDARLGRIYPDWRDDIRFPAAAAMIGIARQDLAEAERWLPGQELLADQYFYVLLWQRKIAEAEQFAERMMNRYRTSIWIERLGDAAFMSGDYGSALRRYEESLSIDEKHRETRVLLKLSDVYFRLGDLDKERLYREMIFGKMGS